jgi:hypothetical protein
MPGVAVSPHIPLLEMPPRSQLYHLPPIGVGTALVESLSSYINRLAWAYRVNARTLVAYEVLPHLSGSHYVQAGPLRLGGFGRTRSMVVNGASLVAYDWAATLGQLTMRSDLRQLTLHQWANDLPRWGLLRNAPQWCPVCYHEWRELLQPIYQPLLWTLQAVTNCLHHQAALVQRCLSCQELQSAIAAKASPGHCTQCGAWLGRQPHPDEQPTSEALDWQRWVMDSVEELYRCSIAFGVLPWNALPVGIAACIEAVGGTRQLARIANVTNVLFSTWRKRQRLPSFTYVLEVGYVLNQSPLQLMTVEPERLKEPLRAKMVYRLPPHFKHSMPRSQGDQALIQAFLQSVLNGETEPLPVRHAAHHLGVGEKYLVGRFPQECAEITAQYLAHRTVRAKERVERECNEVRQAVSALQEQGVIPSVAQVSARLSHPHILRRPEAKATWRTLRSELEIEQACARVDLDKISE